MPVIINEFEAEEGAAAPSGSPGDYSAGGKSKIRQSELRQRISRLAARRTRLWAH